MRWPRGLWAKFGLSFVKTMAGSGRLGQGVSGRRYQPSGW